MKKQILLLQGAGEGAHEWDLPLFKELQSMVGNSSQVHFPKMPEEDRPNYNKWAEEIDKILNDIPDPVIVLGHSLGGSVFLKFLTETVRNRKIAAFFLISSPFWGAPDWEDERFQLSTDFSKKLDVSLPLFIYHSKMDPYVPFEHHEIYRSHLPNAIVRTFEGAGHEMVKAVPLMIDDINSIGL